MQPPALDYLVPRPIGGSRRRAGRGAATLAAAAALALAGLPALEAQPLPREATEEVGRPDARALTAVLLDSAAEPASRDAAADALVQLAHSPDVAQSLTTIVQGTAESHEAATILLAAIGRSWNVPGRLALPLIDAAERADSMTAAPFAAAVAALRSPEAARLLVRFLDADRPVAVRAAAVDALARMTGRDDLGDNQAAWGAWLDRARGLSIPQWDDLLAEGVWRRAQRLDADRRAMVDRLTEGYRRLYLALPASPADDRSRLLSQMLLGQRPELRSLGFEIVSREVAAGKTVDGAVATAALSLLDSSDPLIRAKAAALIVQLPDTPAGPRLARALITETDPAAASQMLLGLARWPDPAGREPAIRWLESGSEAAPAAADALLAIYHHGGLSSPPDRERVAAALRTQSAASLTPSACRLLVAFGSDHDRGTVASLLSGPALPLRLAAAEALADRPEFLDAILAAARSDSALFDASVSAVARNRPTADGYRAVASLPAPGAEDRKSGLIHVSSALSSVDLLQIARETEDLPMREALLSRLMEHGAAPAGSIGEGEPAAISAGIILLARTQLAMKRPDLAAASLDALPVAPEGVDPAELLSLRTVALLWSNRLEDAAKLSAPPGAWLDGLERAINEPHAKEIYRRLKQQFGTDLAPDDASRLQRLVKRLSAIHSGGDTQTATGDEPEGG